MLIRSWKLAGLSQTFYREKLYRNMGFENLDEFLSGFWQPLFGEKDARNVRLDC